MNSSPSPLTPEELALLPHDDKGPALLTATWVLTVSALVFLGLRIYCKLLGKRGLWWDDWILIAAGATLIVNAATTTSMVQSGFGVHIWDFQPPSIEAFALKSLARTTFTIVTIVWTKTAFAVSLLRITDGWMKKCLWLIIVTMNIALGLSALLGWVQCKPVEKLWKPMIPGTCQDHRILLRYSIFSGAYSGGMDFILALLPWKVLAGLQMRRREKAGIAIALSMGIFAGIAAIIKTVNLPKLYGSDIYDSVNLVIWDIAEGAVTMVAACIPVLRVLIRDARSTLQRYNLTGETPTIGQRNGQGWKLGSVARVQPTSRATHMEDQSDTEMLDMEVPIEGHIVRTRNVEVICGEQSANNLPV